MEGRFVFQLSSCIVEEQQVQVIQALEKRKEWISRQTCPRLWKLTDGLNQRPKAPTSVLAKRRKQRLFLSLLNWILGMFALIPALIDPKELWVVLIIGAICLGTGSGSLWREYRGVLAAVSFPAGAVLCLGAMNAWEELGRLLILGIGEVAVAIAAFVTQKHRKVKGGAEEQMAQTLLRSRQELPKGVNAFVSFAEEGMTMSQEDGSVEKVFPYSEFLCMLETQDLLLAVMGETGLLLQKKELTQGTVAEFQAFLETYVPWVSAEKVQ